MNIGLFLAGLSMNIGLYLAGLCCYLLVTEWKAFKRGVSMFADWFKRVSGRFRSPREPVGRTALPFGTPPAGTGDPIDSLTVMLQGFLEQQRERLRSNAPDPTQASVDAMLGAITRIRVLALDKRTLLETDDPASIAALARALVIVDGRTWDFSCAPNQTMELYAGSRLAATIGWFAMCIRWDAWKLDAELRDPALLEQWLAERGVVGGVSE